MSKIRLIFWIFPVKTKIQINLLDFICQKANSNLFSRFFSSKFKFQIINYINSKSKSKFKSNTVAYKLKPKSSSVLVCLDKHQRWFIIGLHVRYSTSPFKGICWTGFLLAVPVFLLGKVIFTKHVTSVCWGFTRQ